MPLTSMLRTTDEPTGNKPQSTQAEKQDAPGGVGGTGNADGAGRGNENLSSTGE